jgi:predicted Holliday junction resolvase-like endonuclease
LIFVFALLSIPMVALLLRHRRFVLELKHSAESRNTEGEAALRREVAELKEMVHTQMLAFDRYAKVSAAAVADETLQDRVSSGRRSISESRTELFGAT